jgi:hypothetical protein
MTTPAPIRSTSMIARLLVCSAAACLLAGCSTGPQSFNSPDEAVQTMIGALKPLNKDQLLKVFGSEGEDIISSGDPVADVNGAERFLDAYNQKHELITADEHTRTLQVGPNDWPFPVPIIEDGGKWSFDADAGREEILNRRIGANELSTIQVCMAIVDAQRDYVGIDPNNDGMHEYAAKFFSEPGKHDGLYWETTPGEPPSPLGPLVAEASEEGYRHSASAPTPYHGYYYRILTSQGAHAADGAYDYLIKGQMIGGFGVVAWPATYENSGIMTFITNQDGVVYQKDLGDDTDRLAKGMTMFDPGDGWKKVE